MKWTYLKASNSKTTALIDLFMKTEEDAFMGFVLKETNTYYKLTFKGVEYKSNSIFASTDPLVIMIEIPSFCNTEIKIPEGFKEITENEYINAMEGI